MANIKLDKERAELSITVSLDKNEWKASQKHAFDETAENVEVKGFRKGNIPMSILKKNVSQEEVFRHALTHSLEVLSEEANRAVPADVVVLDRPLYNVEQMTEDELEVTFIFPTYPEMKISDYKNLEVKYEVTPFDESVVTQELEKIQEQQSGLVKKDGPIESGDTAIFDFEGSVDGVLFPGGTAKGYTLEIGSGQFIPGFEDQMFGMKAGEEKDVVVTFPADYQETSLAAKEAVFKVLVHEVKVKKAVELTDAFAKSAGIPNVSTMEEFKAYIREVYAEQTSQQDRQNFQKKAFTEIQKDTDIVVPSMLLVKEMKNQETEFAEQIKKQGLNLEQYIQMSGVKTESIELNYRKKAERKLKEALIFAEIAKLEKITLSDDDYAKEYVKLAKVYGQSEDAVKQSITKAQMQIPMTNDRVIDALIKYNK